MFFPGEYDNSNDEYHITLPRTKTTPDFLDDIKRGSQEFALNVAIEGARNSDTRLSKYGFYSGSIALESASGTVTLKYGDQMLLDSVNYTGGVVSIPVFRPLVSNEALTLTAPEGSATITMRTLKPNYHDADDGQELVLAYKSGANRWVVKYRFEPESIISIRKILFSYSDRNLYVHDDNAPYNTFFGDSAPTILAFVANAEVTRPRVFRSIMIQSNVAPTWLHLRTEPTGKNGTYIQSSDLMQNEFNLEEGIWKRPFWFDRLSPNVSGSAESKMRKGDLMRAEIAKILVEYDAYDKLVELKTAGVAYDQSIGHVV